MTVISVISMKGGVGKTSITANLASALAQHPSAPKVSVIDLDPQNALQWHFGFVDHSSSGLCQFAVDGGSLKDAALKSDKDIVCFPYGFADELTRVDFESLLKENPEWLKQEISRLDRSAETIFLIDTPPGPSPYLSQAISAANLAIVVLLADAASYATCPAMETAFEEMIPLNTRLSSTYLLNQIDPTDTLSTDIQVMLRQSLNQRLVPVHINNDEAVREALAFQQSVLMYDENCLASHDFVRLAKWAIGMVEALSSQEELG
jgi:cellulose synthase operon protein YhjQ